MHYHHHQTRGESAGLGQNSTSLILNHHALPMNNLMPGSSTTNNSFISPMRGSGFG